MMERQVHMGIRGPPSPVHWCVASLGQWGGLRLRVRRHTVALWTPGLGQGAPGLIVGGWSWKLLGGAGVGGEGVVGRGRAGSNCVSGSESPEQDVF